MKNRVSSETEHEELWEHFIIKITTNQKAIK